MDLQPGPFRSSFGNPRAALEALREADRLLDSAPRTAREEALRQATDRASIAVAGGLLGVALAHAHVGQIVGDASVASTPGASRELGEAIALLRKAIAELEQHPAAAALARGIANCERASITTASRGLGLLVRQLHTALRQELGLHDVPPLVDWNVHDVEDDAALQAAGLSRRKRAIMIGIFAAIMIAAAAFVYVQLFGDQSKADGMRALCDLPINCPECISTLERGDARRYRAYVRKQVRSRELAPTFEAMAASPSDALEILRTAAVAQGIPRCTLVDSLEARNVVTAE